MEKRDVRFWLLQAPGWLLLMYLIYAQALPAFNYELGVAMGTQEAAAQITEVGVAFWYGFAVGDLAIYIPLLLAGLAGHWRGRTRGRLLLAGALGITLYWPVVSLTAVVAARDAPGWNIGDEAAYWVVLPLIAVWAAWALSYLSGHDRHRYS
jgi:hypothetical protein